MSIEKKILLAVFCVGFGLVAVAQSPIPLKSLQTAVNKPGTEGDNARQVGVTDGNGKQRYVAYTDVLVSPIGYTPAATGNTINLSRFVQRNDSIWYIDFEGDSKLLKVPGGGAVNDADWLKIRNNGVPYSITDSIYTLKTVSINGRNYFPDVELNVYDSTSVFGATVAAIGNRGGRFAGYNTVSGAWSSFGQEGSIAQVYGGAGTTHFSVSEVTGTAPGSPSGTFEQHFELDLVNNNAKFNKYPNTRNDSGKPVNLLTTNSSGGMESHPVEELLLDSISTNYGLLNFRKSIAGYATSIIDVVVYGDSRTQSGYVPSQLRKLFSSKYRYAGMGAVNLGIPSDISGMSVSYSGGTTTLDITGIATRSVIGGAVSMPTGGAVTVTTSDPVLTSWDNVDIWYPLQSDAHTYSVTIDGIAQAPFTTATGVSGCAKVSYSASVGTHAIVITRTSAVGTGALFECVFRSGTNGVRVSALGNGGLSAAQMQSLSANTYLFSDMDPSLTMIRVGVNGMGSGGQYTISSQIQSSAYNIVNAGGKDIMILGETDNTEPDGRAAYVDAYNRAFFEMADTNGYAWVNLKNVARNWVKFTASGGAPPGNTVHENALGGVWMGNYIYENIYNNKDFQTNKESSDIPPVVLDSVLSLTGVLNTGNRGLRFGVNSTYFGNINFVPSTGFLDVNSGLSPGYDGRIRLRLDDADRILMTSSETKISHAGVDKAHIGAATTTLYNNIDVYGNSIRVVGANPLIDLQASNTSLNTGIKMGTVHGQMYHHPSSGKTFYIAGNTAAWDGSHRFIVDGTERVIMTQNGVVIDYRTNTSPKNPLTLSGLQAGSASDSLLSSQSGVVKRIAFSQLAKYPLRMELVDGDTDVPAPGTLTKEVIRIPAQYNGYSLIGVNYSVRTTGVSGDLDIQIRKNGSGTAGATFNAGQGQKDVTLTGITVATGDLIDVEIITNSMATPQKGLWVTLILSPN